MKIDWKTLSRILILFIVLRSVLSVWMWAAQQISPTNPGNITQDLYKGTAAERNPWLEPWQRWDTLHDQAIAEHGYEAFDSALFTPPFFPFLMSVTAFLFGGNTLASGLFVSAWLFLPALSPSTRSPFWNLAAKATHSEQLFSWHPSQPFFSWQQHTVNRFSSLAR